LIFAESGPPLAENSQGLAPVGFSAEGGSASGGQDRFPYVLNIFSFRNFLPKPLFK
jgi:hypothetical protein